MDDFFKNEEGETPSQNQMPEQPDLTFDQIFDQMPASSSVSTRIVNAGVDFDNFEGSVQSMKVLSDSKGGPETLELTIYHGGDDEHIIVLNIPIPSEVGSFVQKAIQIFRMDNPVWIEYQPNPEFPIYARIKGGRISIY